MPDEPTNSLSTTSSPTSSVSSAETQPAPSRPSNRLAPPTLFIPPSRNASAADLHVPTRNEHSSQTFNNSDLLPDRNVPTQTPTSTRIPLLRQRSAINANEGSRLQPSRSNQEQSRQPSRQVSSTSQTWTELQNTLEEVELSAVSGANVFGAEHSRALEELRKAQVELAQAWARGEEGEGEDDDDGLNARLSSQANKSASGQELKKTSAVLTMQRGKISSGAEDGQDANKTDTSQKYTTAKKTQLEEETENDIQLARKRRVANDKYFERVNKGVVDVVAKLEVVAKKMGGVEMESQEIWGDKDSVDSASIR